ncbi:MAG: SDR family oxidoreductase [Verrucomicrobiales bacterium]|nr:SDR family oxidoreductase [Verrucomicrobiales bacterium]
MPASHFPSILPGRSSRSRGSPLFDLTGRVSVITGAAGLLGRQHAAAIYAFGGIPVLADVDRNGAIRAARETGSRALGIRMDVTNPQSVQYAASDLVRRFGGIDILINNAARNPKVEAEKRGAALGRLEETSLRDWELDLAVGLTGAMLCSRYFGERMAKRGRGVILNIASDLALIGPDQRLYRKRGIPESEQPRKPVSYSVVKSGLIGLTRYLATYWASAGVRVNALCPGGVENGQPAEFLERISRLIPLARMAKADEYQGAIVFLCSDASSYMTGSVVAIDGGRTCW